MLAGSAARTALLALASLPLAALASGCQLDRCAGRPIAPGEHETCPVPGWTDRAFDLYVPSTWDGVSPLPVVIDIHGGGGKRSAARRGSCPNADTSSPDCLTAVADRMGVAVVFPDGTSTPVFKGTRTWNAGGGEGGFNCVSGAACKGHVDDPAYFADLLDELDATIPVDPRRLYATGLSNGGAMSHRLGCQMASRFAAIAPVSGGNQWAETGGACNVQMPVLHIHGTADPCWRFEQSAERCGPLSDNDGIHVGIPETMEGWRVRNGCDATTTETPMPDGDPSDGITSTRIVYDNCAADTELIRIDGGGHSWPGGDALLPESIVGKTAHDWNANQVILEFFLAHPKP